MKPFLLKKYYILLIKQHVNINITYHCVIFKAVLLYFLKKYNNTAL